MDPLSRPESLPSNHRLSQLKNKSCWSNYKTKETKTYAELSTTGFEAKTYNTAIQR